MSTLIKNKKYKIYIIKNKINGKFYIGQTYKTLIERFWEHCAKNNKCYYIRNAIQKYGKDNFSIDLLDITSSIEKANDLEIFYISKYNSTNRNIGYNICLGGRASNFSDETKKKISNKIKGRILSDKHKENLSKAHKGKKLSKEHKLNISKSGMGRKVSDTTKELIRDKNLINSIKDINNCVAGNYVYKKNRKRWKASFIFDGKTYTRYFIYKEEAIIGLKNLCKEIYINKIKNNPKYKSLLKQIDLKEIKYTPFNKSKPKIKKTIKNSIENIQNGTAGGISKIRNKWIARITFDNKTYSKIFYSKNESLIGLEELNKELLVKIKSLEKYNIYFNKGKTNERL